MKPIGGFFDLELPPEGPGPHVEAVALSTGRACMALWIQEVRPARCFVPFYCCNALFQPLQEAGIPFEFYAVNDQLHPVGLPECPRDGDWLIWTNFFGLIGDQLEFLTNTWGNRVFVDNTHAFFDAQEPGLWSFTSARKYFGVPDGAYCYRPDADSTTPDVERFLPDSVQHLVARYTKATDEAFSLYQAAEAALDCSLKKMSRLTERIMAGVDTESVRAARASNFNILAEHLAEHNTFAPAAWNRNESAFCYPFIPKKPIPRPTLYAQKLFIPTLWPDVEWREGDGFELERRLSRDLLPLPIDHRYKPDDMLRLALVLQEYVR